MYKTKLAFTLVEMLMALLIVSIILSASLPVISSRQKAVAQSVNQNAGMPIGGIILWTDMETLPDNTWLECNGATIPAGIEYEDARRVFGENLPDLRDVRSYAVNLNNYLAGDFKNYVQARILSHMPEGMVGIWGRTGFPQNWAEATEYRGYFLRGLGTTSSHTYNWTDGVGVARSVTSAYSSNLTLGGVQTDTIREISGISSRVSNRSDNPNGNGALHPHNYWGVAAPHFDSNGVDSHANFYHDLLFLSSKSTPTSGEIRPVNKSVYYIKHTPSATIPDVPKTPNAPVNYRYIAKVRH